MKAFIKKQKTILAIFLYVIILVAIFYFIIKPLLKNISDGNIKIQESLVSQEAKQKRLGELPKLRSQYEMVINEKAGDSSLLTENKAVELIEKIEKMAESTGNKLLIEVYSGKDKKAATQKRGTKKDEEVASSLISNLPNSEYLEVKISLTGSYNNLQKFLNKLENMEYYCDVISFGITVDPSQGIEKKNTPTGSSDEKSIELKEEIVPQETILKSTISAIFYLKK